jgi:hypothetical protein
MKKTWPRRVKLLFLASSLLLLLGPRGSLSPQEYPPKRPISDYLSSFLSRSTQPLGLKEDQKLRQLLYQSTIKWVIRANPRHLLN